MQEHIEKLLVKFIISFTQCKTLLSRSNLSRKILDTYRKLSAISLMAFRAATIFVEQFMTWIFINLHVQSCTHATRYTPSLLHCHRSTFSLREIFSLPQIILCAAVFNNTICTLEKNDSVLQSTNWDFTWFSSLPVFSSQSLSFSSTGKVPVFS